MSTPRRLQADLLLDAHAQLAEGPCWEAARGLLLWVDILAGRVHRLDPESGTDSALDAGQHVGAAVPRAAGGLLLAVRDGFATLDEQGHCTVIRQVEADQPDNRMNDGKCDPLGRFWAGTMAYKWEERPGAGALYRLDPDRSVRTMLTGVSISNGLAWSADARTFYYIDSPTRGVDAFDFDLEPGTLAERRRLVSVPAEAGMPDGMAIDHDGCLWVALYGGGAVHRYTPDATLDTIVEVPATQVTSCTFGGPDGGDLFITTAAQDLTEDQLATQPHAGALFSCRPGSSGPPPTPAAI